MKKKLRLCICTGTACYVQGGSYLFDLEDKLTDEEKARVEISGTSCLGYCSNTERGAPPFIEINGEIMSEVSLSSLLDEVKKRLYGGER